VPSAAVSKDMRGTKGNKKKELKIDLTKIKMTVSLSPEKDELAVSQRTRSSTPQTNGHASPAKK